LVFDLNTASVSVNGMAKQITTTRALYKFLLRETKKLPEDAGKFYSKQIRATYEQHAEEDDPERIQQIIERSIEDAQWIVKKYNKK